MSISDYNNISYINKYNNYYNSMIHISNTSIIRRLNFIKQNKNNVIKISKI